jgi:hypothetical protein
MGMGIRYDNTHTINTVLLVIFDTVHTVSIRWPGLVTQCHSGTGRQAWPPQLPNLAHLGVLRAHNRVELPLGRRHR